MAMQDLIESTVRGRRARLTQRQLEELELLGEQVTRGAQAHGEPTYQTLNDLPLSAKAILDAIEDDRWAWATAAWLPGNVTRRRFATTAEARTAAREFLEDQQHRKTNPLGVLVHPVGGGHGFRVLGFDEREEG